MAFSNVNIGSYPDDGTGDPLRVAFNVINNNFANITNGSVTVNAPVKSVAGRTGNVTLTITDISGAASYAYVAAGVTSANAYTDSQIAIVNANIATLSANLTASITANVIANINLAGTNANIAAANVAIAQLQANDVSQNSSISSLNSSVVTIQNSNNANSANITLLQSGATATNLAVSTLSANLGSFQTYANATFSTGGGSTYGNSNVSAYLTVNPPSGTYSNSNVASYLPISTVITGINGNITAINISIAATNSNVTQLQSNSVTQFTWLNNLTVTTGATTNSVVSLQNNQSNDEANIATLQSGIIATNSAIVTANTAMKNYVDANAISQLSQINGSNAAIVTANTAMQGYVDAVTTAWTANAATQSILINTINANIVAINLAVATHTTNISSLQSNSVTQFTWLNNLTASVNSISTTLTTEQNTLSAVVANVTTGYINIAGNITGGNLISTHNVVTTGNVIASEFYYTNGSPVSAVTGDIYFTNSNLSSIRSNTIGLLDDVIITGNMFVGNAISSTHNILGNVVFGPVFNLVASADSIITINPGTSTPQPSNNTVHVQTLDGKTSVIGADSYGNTNVVFSSILLRRGRGTGASPANVALGDVLGSFVVRGYGSSGFTQQSGTLGSLSPSGLSVFAAENYTDIAQGSYIYLNTTRIGSNSATTAMKIDSTGNIVIPVTTTSSNISTGALVVKGGVGIAGNLNIGGNIISNSYLFANGVSILTGVTYNYSNSNVSSYLTVNPQSGTYSNSNVSSYLTVNPQSGTYSNANIVANLANYVTNIVSTANITAGNLLGTHYGNVIGATATHTGNVTINGFVSMTGNLGVDGGQVTMYDSILDLHTYANTAAWASDDGKDIGLRMHYFNGVDSLAFIGLENSTRSLQFLINATETNSNVTGTFGNAQLGSLFLSNTTVSTGATPTTSGALYVAGGAGIAGNVNVGGNVITTGNVYSNGNIAMVSSVPRNVYVNSVAPTSTQGNVGDIWYQTF